MARGNRRVGNDPNIHTSKRGPGRPQETKVKTPVPPRGLNNSTPDTSLNSDVDHLLNTTGDIPAPIPPTPAPSAEKMTRSESASNAANSRWAGEKATESEIRELFSTLPTDDAIQLLGKMRNNCETAGRAINDAIQKRSKGDRCHTCGGSQRPGRQWAFVKAVKDPVTFQMYNIFFCTNACVAAENIKNQGPQGANVIR